MQDGIFSLMRFNVVVDNSIRTWVAMMVEDQMVDHGSQGDTVGRSLRVFYADNGMVGSCDSECMQHVINVPVGLFRRYGLVANVVKTQTMTCQSGALRVGMSEEAMVMNWTGMGESYRVKIQRQIPCPECGVELTVGYIEEQHRRMYGTEPPINWSRLPVSHQVHQPQVYNMRFPLMPKQ